jgi:hypothetical protein
VAVVAFLLVAVLLALAMFLRLGPGPGSEPAAPSEGRQEVAGRPEPAPLTPRLDLGMGTRSATDGERPPLEARPSLPPEERFRGVARIEGHLDLPAGTAVPRPWTLVMEPSEVLIGGDRARAQRVVFEQGETEFVLAEVPLGGYEVRAEADGMSGPTELILLARPDTQNVVLQVALRPSAYVEGLVERQDGAPVEGLPLTLKPMAGGESRVTVTDARGAYLFEVVPDGEYRLFAGHPMSPVAPALDLQVVPPSLHVPRIEVPPLGELTISVVDDQGLPVEGAEVGGWGSHGGRVDVTTDAAGQGHVRFLPAGRYTLRAWAGEGPERRTGRAPVDLPSGGSERVVIRLGT